MRDVGFCGPFDTIITDRHTKTARIEWLPIPTPADMAKWEELVRTAFAEGFNAGQTKPFTGVESQEWLNSKVLVDLAPKVAPKVQAIRDAVAQDEALLEKFELVDGGRMKALAPKEQG
jgi:hypothetical protein